MIGSRSGWREMPYLDCPVGVQELATALEPMQISELPGRTLWFVPGVADQSSASVPDVVRGEETQVCGLLDALQQGSHVVCLPGTHSKWIVVRDGRLQSINTAMTGEIYAVLRQHSMLSKLMGGDDSRFDAYALSLIHIFSAGSMGAGIGGELYKPGQPVERTREHAVSYTHLDVYKRQVSRSHLWHAARTRPARGTACRPFVRRRWRHAAQPCRFPLRRQPGRGHRRRTLQTLSLIHI